MNDRRSWPGLAVAQKKGRFYKRPFDLTVLAVAHLFPLFLPVWIILWTLIPLLIWLEDRGPVFYKQKRTGRNEREFTLLKFRTMRRNQADGEPTIRAIVDDPRVTRIGKILRRTALDELPQVLSILKGDMSLVGPRPMPPDFHQEFLRVDSEAWRRTLMRPGLSGMAQVYTAYDATFAEKLALDLLYMEKMSMWLDIKLLTISAWTTLTAGWEMGAKKRRRVDPIPAAPRENQ